MYFDNINLKVNNNAINAKKIKDLKVLRDTYQFIASLEKMVQFIYKDRMTQINYEMINPKQINYGTHQLNSTFYKKEIVLGQDKDIMDILFSKMAGNAAYDTTFMYNFDNNTCDININDNELNNKFENDEIVIPYNNIDDFNNYENQIMDYKNIEAYYTFKSIDNSLKDILITLRHLYKDDNLTEPINFIDEVLQSNLLKLNPDHFTYIWYSLPQDSEIRDRIAEYDNKTFTYKK